jgi:hypothetical protein
MLAAAFGRQADGPAWDEASAAFSRRGWLSPGMVTTWPGGLGVEDGVGENGIAEHTSEGGRS